MRKLSKTHSKISTCSKLLFNSRYVRSIEPLLIAISFSHFFLSSIDSIQCILMISISFNFHDEWFFVKNSKINLRILPCLEIFQHTQHFVSVSTIFLLQSPWKLISFFLNWEVESTCISWNFQFSPECLIGSFLKRSHSFPKILQLPQKYSSLPKHFLACPRIFQPALKKFQLAPGEAKTPICQTLQLGHFHFAEFKGYDPNSYFLELLFSLDWHLGGFNLKNEA